MTPKQVIHRETMAKDTVVTDEVKVAADAIRKGGIVAFPTETVYGLGADAFNEAAVRTIFEAKGRPPDNPLIVHIASLDALKHLTTAVSPDADRLISAFFPGPLTIVFNRSARVPDATTAGLNTVGIRWPDHPTATALIKASGTWIAAPSANRSGRPSPTTWEEAYHDLNGRVDVILKGEKTRVGLESTVVDCTGSHPLILRPGCITVEDLKLVVPETRPAVSAEQLGQSPGTRHRHYQPDANVLLVDDPSAVPGGPSVAFIGYQGGEKAGLRKLVADVDEYAHQVFSFFRQCEQRNIHTIYCQRVELSGLGVALMDRLERAAAP